jgi:PIN domain nuclease of toxin-antitoxin system
LRLLLDTHVLIWGYEDRVPAHVEAAIRSPANQTFVSVVSFWEIVIKVALGKLRAPDDLADRIDADPDLQMLQISRDHVWRVRTLPRRHGDRFDHLLIAQALGEDLTLVTRDHRMAAYGAATLLA